jgi:hypothetical protein
MSIAELIVSIANKVKSIKDNVLAAYDAIADKNGEVPSEKTMENLPAAIGSIETPEAEEKEVNFYDYKGKRVFSYSASEAMALTELPEYTSPDPIVVFDRWSEDLETVKMGLPLDVGAYYKLNNEYIGYYNESSQKEWDAVFRIKLLPNCDTITFNTIDARYYDFGDGTTRPSSYTPITSHTYPQVGGEYLIKGFNNVGAMLNNLVGAEVLNLYIGNSPNVCTTSNAHSTYSLRSVTIPYDYDVSQYFYRGIQASNLNVLLLPPTITYLPLEYSEMGKVIIPSYMNNINHTESGIFSSETLIFPYGLTDFRGKALRKEVYPTTILKILHDIPRDVILYTPIPPVLSRLLQPNFHNLHIPIGSLDAYKSATNWSQGYFIEDIPTTINSFSITADDVAADATTTTIHVKANLSMGAMYDDTMVPRDLERDVTSDAFEANTTGQPRQVTISFTMLGETRTCTITQGA